MLANTLTLTINAIAKVLVRINQDNYSSEYFLKDTLDSWRLKIRHTKSSKGGVSLDRHNVELVHVVYATTTTVEISRKVYLVFELDPTDTMTNEVSGFCSWLIASSNAIIVSLGGSES